MNSGDTVIMRAGARPTSRAQRRPEHELRRHPGCSRAPPRHPRPLNEGRSMNSGDTASRSWGSLTPPRSLNEGRSMNSGDTDGVSCTSATISRAQRRPEHELRRHPAPRTWTRASPAPLNEGRSMNSGDTRSSTPRLIHGPRTLNEGRSMNSGDTRRNFLVASRLVAAQRRPEHELRRHPAEFPCSLAVGGRSTKAGA